MFRLKCPKNVWTHDSTAWDFELRWEKSFWLNEMIILLGVTYSMGLCNPQITGSNYFSKWKWFKIKFEKNKPSQTPQINQSFFGQRQEKKNDKMTVSWIIQLLLKSRLATVHFRPLFDLTQGLKSRPSQLKPLLPVIWNPKYILMFSKSKIISFEITYIQSSESMWKSNYSIKMKLK